MEGKTATRQNTHQSPIWIAALTSGQIGFNDFPEQGLA
jgi:hypothetical protein